MARIVTVYENRRAPFRAEDMSYIRWLKISEALARRGHLVDIATGESGSWWTRRRPPVRLSESLRRVSFADVRWADYDVVKTLFHVGFETLEAHGGAGHPFIISKLGSVVASTDRDGVYFFGRMREQLYATQQRIERASTYVTVLSEPARALWAECFGPRHNVLLVRGAADREIPERASDPFPRRGRPRCLFAGNVYGIGSQPEANRVLVDKLNRLGRLLSAAGIDLYVLGPGHVSLLDRRYVAYLPPVPHEQAWSYLHHAHVGIVVAPGPWVHNNESTKIYHYLRAGLPVVSETGFPNDHVVRESGLGFVVDNGNLELMARKIGEAVETQWDRAAAIRYILANHTWDERAAVYDALLAGRLRAAGGRT